MLDGWGGVGWVTSWGRELYVNGQESAETAPDYDIDNHDKHFVPIFLFWTLMPS